jgi:hypothetical protein
VRLSRDLHPGGDGREPALAANSGPVIWRVLVSLCAVSILALTACGPSGADATPTLGFDAISTYAAQTFEANAATDTALSPPTLAASPTALPSPFPTFALPASLPTIAFATSTPLASGGSECDNAAYIEDLTIPDNTHLDPGQKFTKTWLVQNTGTCPWSTSYKLVHVDGLAMSGAETFVPLQVPVGQQAQLSVDMKAPTSSGQYYGRWRLENANNAPFGSILTVVIKVEPLATATP